MTYSVKNGSGDSNAMEGGFGRSRRINIDTDATKTPIVNGIKAHYQPPSPQQLPNANAMWGFPVRDPSIPYQNRNRINAYQQRTQRPATKFNMFAKSQPPEGFISHAKPSEGYLYHGNVKTPMSTYFAAASNAYIAEKLHVTANPIDMPAAEMAHAKPTKCGGGFGHGRRGPPNVITITRPPESKANAPLHYSRDELVNVLMKLCPDADSRASKILGLTAEGSGGKEEDALSTSSGVLANETAAKKAKKPPTAGKAENGGTPAHVESKASAFGASANESDKRKTTPTKTSAVTTGGASSLGSSLADCQTIASESSTKTACPNHHHMLAASSGAASSLAATNVSSLASSFVQSQNFDAMLRDMQKQFDLEKTKAQNEILVAENTRLRQHIRVMEQQLTSVVNFFSSFLATTNVAKYGSLVGFSSSESASALNGGNFVGSTTNGYSAD